MVLEFGENPFNLPIQCLYNRIGPEQSSKVMTKQLVKNYRVVNNKGLLGRDYVLYPFGFK